MIATRPNDPVVIFALLATTTGLLFKIAAVPFHQWAPDAYEGAPTSITGFMSVAVKSAGWAMLLRIFLFGLYPLRPMYVPLLIFVSIATMTGGNLAAITQDNLKRLLAYSSIAHVGYMLLGLIASDGQTNSTGIMAIMIYLLVYTFMNLGAFAVITSLRRRNIIGDTVDDIAGLYFKAPTEAILMLIFLLSLAGIPPLAGFWGKYFIFLSLIQTGHYTLAAIGVLYSVVGLYYYMRIANCDAHAAADRCRAGAYPSGDAAGADHHRGRHGHYRPLPERLHQRRQLVAGAGAGDATHGEDAAVRRAARVRAAFNWIHHLRPNTGSVIPSGAEGSAVLPAGLRGAKKPQILRLRARPTRKKSGSERLCGRSAQDDSAIKPTQCGPRPALPGHSRSAIVLTSPRRFWVTCRTCWLSDHTLCYFLCHLRMGDGRPHEQRAADQLRSLARDERGLSGLDA